MKVVYFHLNLGYLLEAGRRGRRGGGDGEKVPWEGSWRFWHRMSVNVYQKEMPLTRSEGDSTLRSKSEKRGYFHFIWVLGIWV